MGMIVSDFDPRDRKRFLFEMTSFRKLVTGLVSGIFKLGAQLEVDGLHHFPLSGPVIVAANHVTNLDVFPMQLALPRPIFFMGKAELFENPLLDVLLRNLGAYPVYRGEKDQWALRHSLKVLEHGQTLGIFPEGTRSHGSGLGVGKTGAARLAIETGCPVVPMAITGSEKLFVPFTGRNRVQVTLRPPLLSYPDESPLALTDRIMFSLAQGLPPEMRGVYANAPAWFKNSGHRLA